MARLRILSDRNIPFVEQAFAALGEVVTLPSTELTPERVADADLLLVRSTVKVDERLLGKSRCRFVATATIGTDHLDLPWLEARGIAWASAPGSNAQSVVQWLLGALLTVAERRNLTLAGMTVGVVGVGQIGRRVEAVARALGCEVLRCDPPRARIEGAAGFVALDALLAAADVITLHVPLNVDGPDRTVALLDASRIAALSPQAIVVNASRGPIVDGPALAEARRQGRLRAALLDVFPGEPDVDPSLVEPLDLATPHIAGHSLDGKANGTLAVYQAACAHLGAAARWTPRRALPPLPVGTLSLDARSLGDEAALLAVLRRFYRVEDDDAAMRKIVQLTPPQRAAAFQKFRASYPERREPIGLPFQIQPPRPRAAAVLELLGARPITVDAD